MTSTPCRIGLALAALAGAVAPLALAAHDPALSTASLTTSGNAAMTDAALQALVPAALQDAAARSRLAVAELRVLSAQRVTWSDGSLGCPQPGKMYTQALVPGYRIRIQAGGQTLSYHAGPRGPAQFCPADRVQPPSADSRI